MINSNLNPISHRLAAVARTDFQGHPKSIIFLCYLKANIPLPISD